MYERSEIHGESTSANEDDETPLSTSALTAALAKKSSPSSHHQSMSLRLNSTAADVSSTSLLNLIPSSAPANTTSLSLFTPSPLSVTTANDYCHHHSSYYAAAAVTPTPLRNNSLDAAATKQSSSNPTSASSSATISKSKRLGQILKLASVRGAKSKSMKHKYSAAQQQHSFVTIQSDAICQVCQKTMLNKKALHCKSKI